MSKPTCRFEGCDSSEKCRGYCNKHYQRMRRRGEFGLCKVDDCDNGRYYKDFCKAHYMRVLRGQDVNAPMHRHFKDDLRESYSSGNMQEVFSKVKARCIIVDEAGCWEYPRANGKGYGELHVGGPAVLAHRLMARIALPDYEDHLQVHHKCANRVCCNPAHLQMLTSRENRAEMMERNAYLKRIADLEGALRTLKPEHVLLSGG